MKATISVLLFIIGQLNAIDPSCLDGQINSWVCCKGVSPAQDVLLRNPADCGTYFQCVNEEPLLRTCPADLHWSVISNKCEWPELARCTVSRPTDKPSQKPTTPSDNNNNCENNIPEPPAAECIIGKASPEECCKGVPYWKDVLLPNPQDCGSYLQCVHEKPMVRPCPAGLHWSIVNNRCEWPNIAQCKDNASSSEESGNESGGNGVSEDCVKGYQTAEDCCKGVPYYIDVLLKNPKDCRTYYQCVHEKPMIRPCPSELHWSVSANRCEWPELAGCTATKPTDTPPQKPTTPSSNNNNCENNVPVPPKKDCIIGETSPEECCKNVPYWQDVLLPNPEDCGSYLQCVHEKPMLRPCPAGLHWSIANNRCEWPNIAQCESGISGSEESSSEESGNESGENGVSKDCIFGYRPAEECCKGVPYFIDVLLKNPKNCGTYYQCVHEKPMIRPCPSELHWSVAANRCEWPELAGCTSSRPTDKPSLKPTTPSENNNNCANNNPGPPTNACITGETSPEECCRGVPYWKDVLLPNPQDCGSYLQCVHEKPMVRPCPAGLHWSIVNNRCEWPNIAQCKNNASSSEESGNESEGNGVSEDCVKGYQIAEECCKGVPYYIDVLLKNPNDCGTYYQCVHEKPMLRPCPSELHWSVSANRCEWPELAGCTATKPTDTPPQNQSTPSSNNNNCENNVPVPPKKDCIIGETSPEECCKDVPYWQDVLLPNPEDCGSYLQCVHEKPMLRPCPAGLHWSIASNRCEWPNIAQCESGISSSEESNSAVSGNESEENGVSKDCIRGYRPAEECCKGVPYFIDVLLKNPKNCGTYYQCVHEKPMIRPCPSELHWSVTANRCEWPELAGCTSSRPTDKPSLKPTTPSENNNNCENNNPGPPINECLTGEMSAEACCKGVPYWKDVLLPNPQDCQSYLQCVHEKPMLRPCPAGLHWSIANNRCEWPNIAQCNGDLSSNENGENGVSENCIRGDLTAEQCCKGVPYYIDILLKNPLDCGTYYQCVHEKPIIRPCPSGLHWSVEKNRCEWKDIAKCE